MKKVIVIIYPYIQNDFLYLPFGSSVVASSLDKTSYEVDLYHGIPDDISEYDYVLISSYIWGSINREDEVKCSNKIHNSLKRYVSSIDNKKTILGGSLVKYMCNDGFEVDLVVNGDIDNMNIYMDKMGYIKENIPDVFCMPINYNILNIEDMQIPYSEIFEKFDIPLIPDDKYISTIFTRYSTGCDNKCSFCNNTVAGIRSTNLQNLKDSIKSYVDSGFNTIAFIDTYIGSNMRFAEDLCDWIVKENLDIKWSHSTRLAHSNPDFYKMLYDAGCCILYSGMESMSTRMLKEIRKGVTVDKMIRNLEDIHNAGIFSCPNVIVGLPNETMDDLQESLNRIVDIKDIIDTVIINKFIMYANTDYHLNPKNYDLMVATVNSSEMIYCEKRQGLNYTDTKNKRQSYFDYTKQFLRDNGIRFGRVNQHLLFALYNQLGSKESVRENL